MHSLYLFCGLLCDEASWGDVPERLADIADVHIVSFPGLSSIGAMAAAFLAIAPAEFAVAGHSMGGRVALETWKRDPRRIAGIALLNSGVNPPRDAEIHTRGRMVRLARERGMRALAAEWIPPLIGSSPERTAQLMPILTSMVERSTVESFAKQTAALLHRPDARPVLASIDVPTVLIGGTNDTWPSLAQHADIQRSVPHAPLVEIAGAGHMTPIERPDAVARALRAWLRQRPRASR
ncbi:MAG: alpha/beta hydrolase [Pseudomonadota bacterium]|nr:alpha/beta hydrolase [Pseudomonadota bacterium]